VGELTSILFAVPSFLGGAARVLDLGCTLEEYNSALSGAQADYIALRADWMAVGRDLAAAMDQYRAELLATGA
jgi:hypothetical protein